MVVLQINEELSARLEQMAASAHMSTEAYAQELLKQAVEEADDLDLAIEEHRRDDTTLSLEEVKRELDLDRRV